MGFDSKGERGNPPLPQIELRRVGEGEEPEPEGAVENLPETASFKHLKRGSSSDDRRTFFNRFHIGP